MKPNFKSLLIESKKIFAIKNEDFLENSILPKNCNIVFLLSSTIGSIEDSTRKIVAENKMCFIHLDMIQGLNTKDPSAIDFLKENSFADGVITTKSSVAKYAKKAGFLVILRCFLIDSISLTTTEKLLNEEYIDAIEVLPGVMPKVLRNLSTKSSIPIIAGGLISDDDDVKTALKNGAIAISTTKLNIIENS